MMKHSDEWLETKRDVGQSAAEAEEAQAAVATAVLPAELCSANDGGVQGSTKSQSEVRTPNMSVGGAEEQPRDPETDRVQRLIQQTVWKHQDFDESSNCPRVYSSIETVTKDESDRLDSAFGRIAEIFSGSGHWAQAMCNKSGLNAECWDIMDGPSADLLNDAVYENIKRRIKKKNI